MINPMMTAWNMAYAKRTYDNLRHPEQAKDKTPVPDMNDAKTVVNFFTRLCRKEKKNG